MSYLAKLDAFHKTRPGYAVFGLIELAMAYGFADWALADGFWLWWIVTVFLLLGALQNFYHAIFWRTKK